MSASKGKKYKCPYCDMRNYRKDLILHVEKEHEDMIPKEYTPARVVYNAINKKDHGTCMICHKETEWDENKQRYNTLCKNPRCKKQYVEMVRSRMVHKYGTYKLLEDPEFQKKMLEHRSISGKYKFQDGGVIGYVGSYEKKFLEFMDTFLHVKSYDIISPGPNIPYMYKGKEHVWITDFLYEPYNLVFDIKDGGDNPNTRDMKEYREKQTAKEQAIAEYGDYNYIRLTNNNFEQLISIFMELKEDVKSKKPIIRINESKTLSNDSPFYFYHVIDKDQKINNNGLISLQYMYKHNMTDLFLDSTDKYRDRLCNGWEIYPDKTPSELSAKEIYDGINKFREEDGANRIYFFKYPPYVNLSSYFKDLYKYKKIYRININDSELRKYIKSIDWGYYGSFTGNGKINKSYYENISVSDYFKDYDPNSAMKFASINHISIVPKYGYIPKKFLEEVSIPNTILDIENFEEESAVQEEARLEKPPKFVYHISYVNHDGETFEPRVYDNDNVKNGMERKVKRVCFSDSVTRALYSIFPNGAYDADFYVHIPGSECKVYSTDTNDIYDSDITHELWIKEPVLMKCIGKIHVSGVSNKTHVIDVDKDKAGYGRKKYHETKWRWVEKYEDDKSLYESVSSTLDKDFKSKGKLSINSFSKKMLNKSTINQYKSDFTALKHIRDTSIGYLFVDGKKCVAVIAVEEKDDSMFIQALEIAKEYQGYGLSKQLLDIATKNFKATGLSVNKGNKVAIKIYEKYGFKVYDETDSMLFMKL